MMRYKQYKAKQILAFGESKTLAGWCADPRAAANLSPQAMLYRLYKGWSAEKSVATPVHAKRKPCPVGTVSGMLVTIAEPTGRLVRCRCRCGNECDEPVNRVLSGAVKSCRIGSHPRLSKQETLERKRRNNTAMRERKGPEIRERLRKWKRDNPGAVAAYDAKRRAAKQAKQIAIGERNEVNAIYRRAKSNEVIPCYLCGCDTHQGNRHVDHKIPLARSGPHVASNLAIACPGCNLSKGGRLAEGAISA